MKKCRMFSNVAVVAGLAFAAVLVSCSSSVEEQKPKVVADTEPTSTPTVTYTYSPTNGTVSAGDIWRVRGGAPVSASYAFSSRAGSIEGSFGGDRYADIEENDFRRAQTSPLSTFSIDVDTASYANVRRYLNEGQRPLADAVRIEELVNYFPYDYPTPRNGDPFSVNVEVAACPWKLDHRLVRIGLRGMEVDLSERPASNLVFLVDVSGSMNSRDKLPLLQKSLKMVVDQMTADDSISLVVYAGSSGLVLPPTPGSDKNTIKTAIDGLRAGGSTNGGEGIRLAYAQAKENFIEDGINRVILATDGDFNVGVTSDGELTSVVAKNAKSGVFLSALGFGRGNLNDSMMEEITNKGNGNYAYIDSQNEARKVLVEQMSGTLITIAKDVKIQVEFNPAHVQAYRLVGYENRMLASEDFNDDSKDAGEIGAGHTVTAFYEVVPVGVEFDMPEVDGLKYQETEPAGNLSDEMLTVKLRYKEPDGEKSKLLEVPVVDKGRALEEASDDFVFAASVASFGMLLRDSEYQGLLTMEGVKELAQSTVGKNPKGHRAEFLELVQKAQAME